MDAWVNKVRSINPVQIQFKQLKGVDKYHIHTQINKEIKSFFPEYVQVTNSGINEAKPHLL